MSVDIIGLENGQKKRIHLTADAGAGNPVGTVIVVCSNQTPSNYLPLGTQYDTSLYPVLYALLGTDTTPTASALGLPTLTSGQYAIKATSGLSENAQDNVVAQLNEERSYSTEEVNTGKKWVDGKPIYRKVIQETFAIASGNYKQIDITNLNIDYPIKIDFIYKDGNSAPRCLLNSSSYFTEINFSASDIIIRTANWSLGSALQTIIIEYTKTT